MVVIKLRLVGSRSWSYGLLADSGEDNRKNDIACACGKEIPYLREKLEFLRAATPLVDAYLVTMYRETQEFLRKLGYKPNTYLTNIYRGMQWVHVKEGKVVVHQPLSSFTTDPRTAETFGRVFRYALPTVAIVATPYTGVGCWGEDELVGFVPYWVTTTPPTKEEGKKQ